MQFLNISLGINEGMLTPLKCYLKEQSGSSKSYLGPFIHKFLYMHEDTVSPCLSVPTLQVQFHCPPYYQLFSMQLNLGILFQACFNLAVQNDLNRDRPHGPAPIINTVYQLILLEKDCDQKMTIYQLIIKITIVEINNLIRSLFLILIYVCYDINNAEFISEQSELMIKFINSFQLYNQQTIIDPTLKIYSDMSKFYKTSYSRQPNYNNFLNSANGQRETNKKSEIKSSSIRRKQPDTFDPIQTHNIEEKIIHKQIQKKIQIDSSLLFNVKRNAGNTAKIGQKNIRKSTNKTETKFYQGPGSCNLYKERPHSKQQARIKINLKDNIKLPLDLPDRPHTSKGPRSGKYGDSLGGRRMSIQNIEDSTGINSGAIDRKSMAVSSQSRRPSSKITKHSFNTSIDPEFLALFAN